MVYPEQNVLILGIRRPKRVSVRIGLSRVHFVEKHFRAEIGPKSSRFTTGLHCCRQLAIDRRVYDTKVKIDSVSRPKQTDKASILVKESTIGILRRVLLGFLKRARRGVEKPHVPRRWKLTTRTRIAIGHLTLRKNPIRRTTKVTGRRPRTLEYEKLANRRSG